MLQSGDFTYEEVLKMVLKKGMTEDVFKTICPSKPDWTTFKFEEKPAKSNKSLYIPVSLDDLDDDGDTVEVENEFDD